MIFLLWEIVRLSKILNYLMIQVCFVWLFLVIDNFLFLWLMVVPCETLFSEFFSQLQFWTKNWRVNTYFINKFSISNLGNLADTGYTFFIIAYLVWTYPKTFATVCALNHILSEPFITFIVWLSKLKFNIFSIYTIQYF